MWGGFSNPPAPGRAGQRTRPTLGTRDERATSRPGASTHARHDGSGIFVFQARIIGGGAPPMAWVQDYHYMSISTPLGKDKLLLRRFDGEESLSRPFHFSLDMQSEDGAIDFASIVGKSATITIELADGTQRFINGIVGRFVQSGGDDYFFNYSCELRPWLWLLTMNADCRIWQNKSVIDIVTGLFTELGFTDYRNATTGTYTAIEFCVQYNETAF